MTDRIEIVEATDANAIWWRWSRPRRRYFLIGLFCSGVLGLLSFVAAVIRFDLGAVPVVIGLSFATGFAAFAYVVAAMLWNRTTIDVSGRALVVRHGPLWWPGARSYDRVDVSRVYASDRGTRRTIAVVLASGKTDVVADRLGAEDASLAVRAIERWLGRR